MTGKFTDPLPGMMSALKLLAVQLLLVALIVIATVAVQHGVASADSHAGTITRDAPDDLCYHWVGQPPAPYSLTTETVRCVHNHRPRVSSPWTG